MLRYFVRYLASPAVMMQVQETTLDVADLSVGTPKVKITNRRVQDPRGNVWIAGIQFDVELAADTLEQAVERARQTCEYFATGLSLLSSIGLPLLKLELACDIQERQREHPFLQVIYPPVPVSSRRWVHPKSLEELLHSLDKMPPGRRKALVTRSLGLYRRAIQIDDPIERFMLLFVALEALDYPLGEVVGRVEKTDPSMTLLGVRKFYSNRLSGLTEFKRCRELRNAFAHGKPDVPHMLREAVDLTSKLRRALLDAYKFLLGMESRAHMDLEPIRPDEGLIYRVSTVLRQEREGPLGQGDQPPYYDAIFENLHVVLEPDGHTYVHGNLHLHKRMGRHVSFLPPKLDIIAPDIGEVKMKIQTWTDENEHDHDHDQSPQSDDSGPSGS